MSHVQYASSVAAIFQTKRDKLKPKKSVDIVEDDLLIPAVLFNTKNLHCSIICLIDHCLY